MTISDIVKIVGRFYGIKQDEILNSKSRHQQLIIARFICYYLMKTRLHMTLQSIAWTFQKKDHSAVINGINKFEGWLETDLHFKNAFGNICFLLMTDTHESDMAEFMDEEIDYLITNKAL